MGSLADTGSRLAHTDPPLTPRHGVTESSDTDTDTTERHTGTVRHLANRALSPLRVRLIPIRSGQVRSDLSYQIRSGQIGSRAAR